MKISALIVAMSLFCCMYVAGRTDAEAQDDDLLYRSKCTACHRVYPPKIYTYQTLEAHVTRYGRGLSNGERVRLLEYLENNSKKTNSL